MMAQLRSDIGNLDTIEISLPSFRKDFIENILVSGFVHICFKINLVILYGIYIFFRAMLTTTKLINLNLLL